MATQEVFLVDDPKKVGRKVQRLISFDNAKAVICKKAGQKWKVWVVPATHVKVPKA